MAFSVKNWQDKPSEVTPISAAALEDLEARLGAYADSVVGSTTDVNAVPKSLYTAKGTMVAGSATASAPVTISPPLDGFDRGALVTDTSTTSGFRFSAKTAPYNICEAGASPIQPAANNVTAINAALVAAAGNGPCYCPPGLYDVNAPIAAPSNTHLYGAGNNATVFRTTVGGRLFGNSPFGSATQNVLVRDLVFDGNNPNLPGASEVGALVDITGVVDGARANNWTFRNVHLHHSPGLGISVKWADNVRIQDCIVHDNVRDGIGIGTGCRYGTITGNRVYSVGDDFIAVARATDIVVGNNVLGGGNIDRGTGIALRSCDRVAVSNNTILEGLSNGLAVLDEDPEGRACRDVVLSNNVIMDVGHFSSIQKGNGIQIEAGFGVGTGGIINLTVANNIFRTTKNWGALLLAKEGTLVQNVTFQGNQFIGGSSYADVHAVYFGGTAAIGFSQMRFINNTFREWNGNAINCGKVVNGLDIINNLAINNCKDTAATKAAFLLGPQDGVQVIGNRVTDRQATKTTQYGVAVSGATRLLVAMNNFYGVGAGGRVGTMGAGTAYEHANIAHDGSFAGGTHNTTVL